MNEPGWFPALYDAFMGPLETFSLRRHRRTVLAGLVGRLLDVGVGTGANLGLYASAAEVTAIDVDPGMLARARARPEAVGLDLHLMDVHALEFPDRSFDVVLSTLVFCGIDRPGVALREIKRVLKDGGRLVMIEHTLGPHRAFNAILTAISSFTGPRFGEFLDRPIAGYVAEAGFETVVSRDLALGTFRCIEAIRPARVGP